MKWREIFARDAGNDMASCIVRPDPPNQRQSINGEITDSLTVHAHGAVSLAYTTKSDIAI